MSTSLNSLSLSLGTPPQQSKSHRRHQSDPFASNLAPMTDADMAAFLAVDDDAGDMFLPGSLLSFDDAPQLGDIGDLLLPAPGAPQNWPSPRTPGRKHRRTTSEPVFVGGGNRTMPDVHADARAAAAAAPPVRLASPPVNAGRDGPFLDDPSHPLILGDGLRLDSFDMDLAADDRMDVDAGAAATSSAFARGPDSPSAAPPPPGPALAAGSRPATRARGARPRARSNPAGARSRAREPKDKSKKYRCSRCGQIKANHVCPFVVNDSVAVASQADPTVTVTTADAVTLVARPRGIAA